MPVIPWPLMQSGGRRRSARHRPEDESLTHACGHQFKGTYLGYPPGRRPPAVLSLHHSWLKGLYHKWPFALTLAPTVSFAPPTSSISTPLTRGWRGCELSRIRVTIVLFGRSIETTAVRLITSAQPSMERRF